MMCVLPDDTDCSAEKVITSGRYSPKQRIGPNFVALPELEPATSRFAVLLFATELSPQPWNHIFEIFRLIY